MSHYIHFLSSLCVIPLLYITIKTSVCVFGIQHILECGKHVSFSMCHGPFFHPLPCNKILQCHRSWRKKEQLVAGETLALNTVRSAKCQRPWQRLQHWNRVGRWHGFSEMWAKCFFCVCVFVNKACDESVYQIPALLSILWQRTSQSHTALSLT